MTTYQISIDPIVLVIISVVVGMTIMKIYYRNYKKIKTGHASVSGNQYRFDSKDEKEIHEQIKKDDPKMRYILSVKCTRVLAYGRDSDFPDWDERIYEVKYI